MTYGSDQFTDIYNTFNIILVISSSLCLYEKKMMHIQCMSSCGGIHCIGCNSPRRWSGPYDVGECDNMVVRNVSQLLSTAAGSTGSASSFQARVIMLNLPGKQNSTLYWTIQRPRTGMTDPARGTSYR